MLPSGVLGSEASASRRTAETPPTRPPRLLIFVIAYYAERTLTSVLERIPREIFDAYACTVLVVDDASEDRTASIGREFRDAHPEHRVVVLRNAFNQGYGGNQKVGYTYALREGYDYVVMLHGDAQYAPERLPEILAPLHAGAADAVFGSRMATRFGALQGGMPLYKFVGNRVLTTLQNAMLGTRFTEFHSGYRAYAVAALRRVPFQLNSNAFHFDTEIILQLLNARLRIVEVPIPTYYGDELSRVNGLVYAKEVLLATLRNVVHRRGIFYQRRYDPIGEPATAHYDLKLGYPSSHQFALDAVPAGASVMDIGAGPGGVAALLAAKGCTVSVVDEHPPSQDSARVVTVFVQNLDDPPAFDVTHFDYLLLLDVIEHLRQPEVFLERLRAQFDFTAKTVVFSTPNVAFLPVRVMLALGQFNYGKAGILDRTHTRLFTFRTFRQLLADAGFDIVTVRGIPAPFPKAVGHGVVARIALALNAWLIHLSKSLFSYQIFVVARTTPTVEFVLDDSQRRAASDATAVPADSVPQLQDSR